MRTHLVFFPFDLFGSGGAGSGVELLEEALAEMLADNRRETVHTRAARYTPHIRRHEVAFATLADYSSWREQGRRLARSILREKPGAPGSRLIWLAGNHLGALPVYDELVGERAPRTLVVQLDAHLDIHHFHDTQEELSHGNFLLHCADPLPMIFNIGHRDLLLPREYVAQYFHRAVSASELAVNAATVLSELRTAVAAAERVVLDVDCDVFDASWFSAVRQPVPFGLMPGEVLAVIEAAWSPRLQVVLLSEFDGGRDVNDRALSTLTWLIEYLLLRWYPEE